MAEIKAEAGLTAVAEGPGNEAMIGRPRKGIDMNVICGCLERAARAALLVCAGLVFDVLRTDSAAASGPGSIVMVWPLEGGAPANSEAFRILYRSTGLNGEPIEVSAAIY
jgi:hypothetical protein